MSGILNQQLIKNKLKFITGANQARIYMKPIAQALRKNQIEWRGKMGNYVSN